VTARGGLEPPGGMRVGINKFPTPSSPRTPRVPCLVASSLAHPPVETGFGLHRRRVVATSRVVFISDFPCRCWARPNASQALDPVLALSLPGGARVRR